jgi:hypothetical protein
MPFCPSCEAEYAAGVRVCSECDVTLVEQLDKGSSAGTTDVYRCDDPGLAELVASILKGNGLSPLVRDRGVNAFPTNANRVQIVAVPEMQVAEARQTLLMALEDGVIGLKDGELL